MKPEPEARHADMLLTGGTVLTMDPPGSAAEAVAISRGRILAVGSAGDLAALVGPATEVIDLEGRTVIPGIIDTHAHMEREGLKTLRPSLAAARIDRRRARRHSPRRRAMRRRAPGSSPCRWASRPSTSAGR